MTGAFSLSCENKGRRQIVVVDRQGCPCARVACPQIEHLALDIPAVCGRCGIGRCAVASRTARDRHLEGHIEKDRDIPEARTRAGEGRCRRANGRGRGGALGGSDRHVRHMVEDRGAVTSRSAGAPGGRAGPFQSSVVVGVLEVALRRAAPAAVALRLGTMKAVDGGADDGPVRCPQDLRELVGKHRLPRPIDPVDPDTRRAIRRQAKNAIGHDPEHLQSLRHAIRLRPFRFAQAEA